MLPNNTFLKSIHNFIDKDSIDENEDAIAYIAKPFFDKIAVSDGAGGAGIYCKDWANHLVKNQPDRPFDSKIIANEWFLSISESFYKENIGLINKMDPFILEKFIKEGSYATLFFAWLNKETNDLNYIGIGDTTLLVFRKNKEIYNPILITPINEQKSLDDFPKLLNWNKELNYDMSTLKIVLKPDDVFMICTDSIARWLLYQLIILVPSVMHDLLGESIMKNINKNMLENINLSNKYKNVSELILKIEDILKGNNEFFKKVLDKQINANILEKDDFTIVIKRF
jgi:hypothetical protein